MKKFLLLIIVAFATASVAEAQIASGKYMIGGNANFNSALPSWNLNPSFGYFLTDDIGLGANLRIGDNGGGMNINLGIAGRKYWNIMEKTYLYGHLGVDFGVVGGGGVGLNLYPGVMYFLNDRLAIDGSLAGLGGGGIGLSLLF